MAHIDIPRLRHECQLILAHTEGLTGLSDNPVLLDALFLRLKRIHESAYLPLAAMMDEADAQPAVAYQAPAPAPQPSPAPVQAAQPAADGRGAETLRADNDRLRDELFAARSRIVELESGRRGEQFQNPKEFTFHQAEAAPQPERQLKVVHSQHYSDEENKAFLGFMRK